MLIILRLAFTYALVESLYGDARQYVAYILVFSLLTDLDHLPPLLRRRRREPPREAARSLPRSRFHELYGLILLAALLCIASVFYLLLAPGARFAPDGLVVIQVIALSVVLHYTVDFLLCRTRPLYPFSDIEVFLRDPLSKREAGHQLKHYNKLAHVRAVRGAVDRLLLVLPLPRVNPNLISGLSILTSLGFVMAVRHSFAAALLLLSLTVLLDWLDGVIAQKHDLCSEEGYVVDVAADRLSEAIIFIPFFVPWFYLFLLNSILTLFSFAKGKHIVLPLRQVFLLVFVILEFV